MIHVLIIGLTDTLGGVEKYIKNLVMSADKNEFMFDFLIKSENAPVFEREISSFYENKCKYFHITKISNNPISWLVEMRDFFKRNAYDVIYINTCSASDILYSCIFNHEAKVIIHSHYCGIHYELKNQPFKKLATWKSDLLLACSEKAGNWMFTDDKKYTIIKNGIATLKYKFSEKKRKEYREKYHIGLDELVIGNVGRLEYPKNQIFLVGLLAELIKNNKKNDVYKNIKLILVGDGQDRESIALYANKLGVSDNLIFAGLLEETSEIYNAFDIFIMPSFHEGLPMAGIEAQCNGLPCIFSDGIDRQILITDIAEMHSLDDGYDEWVRAVFLVSRKEIDRACYANQLQIKGYDYKSSAIKVLDCIKDLSAIG